VQIEVFDGDPRSFDASIDLAGFACARRCTARDGSHLAGSSRVARFEWGTVASPAPPANRLLQGLAGQHVLFTLKIIDASDPFRRLVGVAENIRPLRGGKKTATGRQGILPVELSDDIENEPWRVEYRTSEVFLLINCGSPFIRDQLRSDPLVYSLIYPQVVRQVLKQALADQADEDSPEAWQTRWMSFAVQLHPDHEAPPVEDDSEEREQWINAVVSQFCRQHEFLQRADSPIR
jgi:hypothetical protein